MADMSLVWADDLQNDESGDLLTVNGTDELQQRIIRRFLTTPQTLTETTGTVQVPPDYFFEPSYGGGARAYVGSVVNGQVVRAIQAALLNQAEQESDVDPAGTTINVTALPNGVVVDAFIRLNTEQFIAVPQLEIVN